MMPIRSPSAAARARLAVMLTCATGSSRGTAWLERRTSLLAAARGELQFGLLVAEGFDRLPGEVALLRELEVAATFDLDLALQGAQLLFEWAIVAAMGASGELVVGRVSLSA